MTSQNTQSTLLVEEQTQQAAPYEAPAIESVLTTESLEREVLYAGAPPVSGIQQT